MILSGGDSNDPIRNSLGKNFWNAFKTFVYSEYSQSSSCTNNMSSSYSEKNWYVDGSSMNLF